MIKSDNDKNTNKIIQVKNLTKKYDAFTAVDNINFHVNKGEIFGFLGPNGAGKTTTINMLIGLATPTSGNFFVSGINGTDKIKDIQKQIGVVSDESNLYDEMTGLENLIFCASLYGISKNKIENRAKLLLKQFSLDNIGNKPFKTYSKGMKRKLTIAAGIIHEPNILFLDEPTTGIDVESARQIRGLIIGLNKNGTTVFITTHYIEDAQRLCNRIGFISKGKILKVEETKKLLKKSQKEHVVQFQTNSDCTLIEKQLQKLFPDVNLTT